MWFVFVFSMSIEKGESDIAVFGRNVPMCLI